MMYFNVCCLQKERFLKTGWEHADALDMMTVYSMLPQDDVARQASFSVIRLFREMLCY